MGSKEGEFAFPRMIAVHENEVFVADSGNQRVQVLQAETGAFLRQVGQDALDCPYGIAISSTTNEVRAGSCPSLCDDLSPQITFLTS